MTLARDALEIGSDGHPYLRYLNLKLRREAVIPIGPVLHEQLCRQEELLAAELLDRGSQLGVSVEKIAADIRRVGDGCEVHLDAASVQLADRAAGALLGVL